MASNDFHNDRPYRGDNAGRPSVSGKELNPPRRSRSRLYATIGVAIALIAGIVILVITLLPPNANGFATPEDGVTTIPHDELTDGRRIEPS